jgi:hypothetical protein
MGSLNFEKAEEKFHTLIPYNLSDYKISKLDYCNYIKVEIYNPILNFNMLEGIRNEYHADRFFEIKGDGYNRLVITFEVLNDKYFY